MNQKLPAIIGALKTAGAKLEACTQNGQEFFIGTSAKPYSPTFLSD